MAPPNDHALHSISSVLGQDERLENCFDLTNGNLNVNGFPLLFEVPENVSFSPFSSLSKSSDAPSYMLDRVNALSHKGGFLGFNLIEPSDRLTNSLGKFYGRDFLSIFRFKTWWSTMWVGKSGSDLQKETQWVLFNLPEIKSYVIIIPIIQGSFRSALCPGTDNDHDHVMICAESGSSQVQGSNFDSIAYIHVSENPYSLMNEAFGAIRVHLNSFRLLEEKKVPSIVDKFGWCTWDAFYLTVNPAGIFYGLNELVKGGMSPRFLIIDDGWQTIKLDRDDHNEDLEKAIIGGTQIWARMHSVEEGEKFKSYHSGSNPPFNPNKPKMLISKANELDQAEKNLKKAIRHVVKDLYGFEVRIQKLTQELKEMQGISDDQNATWFINSDHDKGNADDYGFKALTRDLRTKFKGLEDIYLWHSVFGSWSGVRPGSTPFNSKIVPCILSPGSDDMMDDLAINNVIEGGVGVVHPDEVGKFYDSLHSYLANSGITGVKVDVIDTIEYVGEEYGGRVELAKAYYKGLNESVVNNFNGTGVIASMEHCNDFFFLGTRQIAMGRAGDDFWTEDQNGDPMGVYWLQGAHMVHCSYNSLWMGQIIQPDWDMFQSDHFCANYHAASRAICGGPIYISDAPGCHNFELLNKLVYPDGTIPRCQHFPLPSRDCLFANPLFDKKTILKLWNFNKYGGVIGAFNCQGAGWDRNEKLMIGYPECYKEISGSVHVSDIEWDQNVEAEKMGNAEEYAVYLNQAEKLRLMITNLGEAIQVTIQPSSFELFSFVPVKNLGLKNIKFAPIGLTGMFNSGGTIQELGYYEEGELIKVDIRVKGGGSFLAYSSECPDKCYVNGGEEMDFKWFADDGKKLTLNLHWIEETCGISNITFIF